MRRRSNRASKATDESAEVVSPKKQKRHSRRRRQSTSDSDDEPISALVDKPSDNVAEDEDCESEVWKVAPTPQSTAEGEIQKLKICLKRPPTSPEKQKRTHKKSSSHHEDDLTEEKGSRKSRRGKSNAEEDVHTEDEKHEEVDDKGKFKSKSISKTEQLNDSDPCNDEKSENTQSDDNISDNVQIEPQNVQSDNINKVDGKVEDIEIEQEEITSEVQEESTAPVYIQNTVPIVEVIEDIVVSEATNQSEPDSKSAIASDTSNESTSHITPPIPMQTEQMVVNDEEPESTVQEVQEDLAENHQEIAEITNEESNTSECDNETKNGIDDENGGEEINITAEVSLPDKYKENYAADSFNVTSDVSMRTDDGQPIPSSPPPREHFQPKSRMIKTFKVTEQPTGVMVDIPLRDASPPRVCVYPQSMMERSIEQDDIERPRLALIKLPKLTTERKRRWGQSAISKDKLPELSFITTNLITEIYPNCKLLDEDKVKLDPPAISAPPPAKIRTKEKRKISIEMPKSPDAATLKESSLFKENGTGAVGIFDHMKRDERENANQASIIALNRKISIVEDTAAKLKPPPSPAKNPVSAVLYVSNLVRPFTLKQLKELLERTGKIIDGGFWTDRIKSKCYAQYESIEDAETTRNALHGVNWPVGNGKKLMIEYSSPEEMEHAKNPPPIQPLIPEDKFSKTPEPTEKENKEPLRRSGIGVGVDHRDHHERDHRAQEAEEFHHRHQEQRGRRDSSGGGRDAPDQQLRRHVREWDLGKGEEPRRSRTRSRDRGDRRGRHPHSQSRSRRSPSPRDHDRYKPIPKVEEPPPQKLMDDLFLKTKATPCIYWQALTPEEIAQKQQQRLERMAEHQRRLQQTTNTGGLGSSCVTYPAPQQYRGGGGGGGGYGGYGRRRY